jgi:hypothetical protein
MRRLSLLCVIAGVVLQSGCGNGPTRPAVTDIRIGVSVTPEVGGPSNPVSIRSRLENAGTTTVWYSTCGHGGAILGPDGSPVAIHDPNSPPPGIPCWYEPLEPGKVFEGAFDFPGVLYQQGTREWPSPTYPAPSGTYTVIVEFGYTTSETGGDFTRVVDSTSFFWVP